MDTCKVARLQKAFNLLWSRGKVCAFQPAQCTQHLLSKALFTRILQVVDAKVVVNKPGRVPQKIAECTIGDDTGVIVFTARNEQGADTIFEPALLAIIWLVVQLEALRGAAVDLAKPGKSIILRNAKIDMYRGSMRLAVNQWGKVEETSDLDFEPRVSPIYYSVHKIGMSGLR